MRLLISSAALILLSVAPAVGGTITIDFEQPSSFLWVDQFYNGGTDGGGLSGPNYGVSFGLDDLAIQNDALGPYFANAPSPIGIMVPVGPETAMNVAAGFTDISLYYSSMVEVLDGVQVWSGLNGTGTLLASFDLAANAQAGGDTSAPVTFWEQLNIGPLSDVAHSVTFATNYTGYDNITIHALPEPASALLLAPGLLGLLALRRRS